MTHWSVTSGSCGEVQNWSSTWWMLTLLSSDLTWFQFCFFKLHRITTEVTLNKDGRLKTNQFKPNPDSNSAPVNSDLSSHFKLFFRSLNLENAISTDALQTNVISVYITLFAGEFHKFLQPFCSSKGNKDLISEEAFLNTYMITLYYQVKA